MAQGKILWQHNDNAPIGVPLGIRVVKDELIIEGYVYDDNYTNGSIGRRLVTDLSTGHITHESMFINVKSGKRYTREELWDSNELIDQYFDGQIVWIVTKAELVETSFVTIGSNRSAHILSNSLESVS